MGRQWYMLYVLRLLVIVHSMVSPRRQHHIGQFPVVGS